MYTDPVRDLLLLVGEPARSFLVAMARWKHNWGAFEPMAFCRDEGISWVAWDHAMDLIHAVRIEVDLPRLLSRSPSGTGWVMDRDVARQILEIERDRPVRKMQSAAVAYGMRTIEEPQRAEVVELLRHRARP